MFECSRSRHVHTSECGVVGFVNIIEGHLDIHLDFWQNCVSLRGWMSRANTSMPGEYSAWIREHRRGSPGIILGFWQNVCFRMVRCSEANTSMPGEYSVVDLWNTIGGSPGIHLILGKIMCLRMVRCSRSRHVHTKRLWCRRIR